jgi:hypothetical protein
MKQSDIKTRKVMDFDTFKGAYDRALHTVSRDPEAPLQDGSRKMTAYPAHVRNDSNPYRAFEIPYDKEEADSNMRIMAHPPMFASAGANGVGEIGESISYQVEEGIVQDPGDNSSKLNLKKGDKVWTIMGPCAGKDYFGVVESDVRKEGMDYVVDVTFYKADNGKISAGKSAFAVDYLHRVDGKKIY